MEQRTDYTYREIERIDGAPADPVGEPAEQQTSDEQSDQRGRPEQPGPHRAQVTLGRIMTERRADNAEHVTIAQDPARAECGDPQVKPTQRGIIHRRFFGQSTSFHTAPHAGYVANSINKFSHRPRVKAVRNPSKPRRLDSYRCRMIIPRRAVRPAAARAGGPDGRRRLPAACPSAVRPG